MSRVRITKHNSGANTDGRKEVLVSTIKAGLSASGEQRWALSIRFANESHKKASDTGYVAVEIDDDLGRIYLLPADKTEGFKLVKTGKMASISFTIKHKDEWGFICGEHDLLYDKDERAYYIEEGSR